MGYYHWILWSNYIVSIVDVCLVYYQYMQRGISVTKEKY